MYWFSIAAVINFHKLCSLNNTHYPIVCRAEVQRVSHWAKSRHWQDSPPSGGSRARPIPCPLQLLLAAHILWLVAPSSIFKACNFASLLPSSCRSLHTAGKGSDFKDPCNGTGPTWITQDHLHFTKSLTQSHLHTPFCHVRSHTHRFRELEQGHLAGRGGR